jgi:hypothetical protein
VHEWPVATRHPATAEALLGLLKPIQKRLGNPNGARALKGEQVGNREAVAKVKANGAGATRSLFRLMGRDTANWVLVGEGRVALVLRKGYRASTLNRVSPHDDVIAMIFLATHRTSDGTRGTAIRCRDLPTE